MLDEEQAFLNAILAEPDDDTVRLVYADWLEEHGRADTAEFIRLQIESAWKSDAENGPTVGEREHQLEQRHYKAWKDFLGMTDTGKSYLTLVRGLPEVMWFRDSSADDILRVLSRLPYIRRLNVGGGELTPDVLRMVARLRQLDVLNLWRAPIEPAWLELLESLPPWTVVELGARDAELEPAWREFQSRRVAGLDKVPPRRLHGTAIQLHLESRVYGPPGRLPRGILENPILGKRMERLTASDFTLALLSRVPQLEEFSFEDGIATPEGLTSLTRLPSLRAVELFRVTATTITPLAVCTRLRTLHVTSDRFDTDALANFTDDSTDGLERLTELRELKLTGCSGSLRHSTVELIGSLKQLRTLELQIGELSDTSLAPLAGLHYLEDLRIEGPTRDADIRHLAGLTNLRFLSLTNSRATDAVFAHLNALRNLKTLLIRGGPTALTAASARELADQLPAVTIILDSAVVKSPREFVRFRRRLIAEFASALLPVHWHEDTWRQNPGTIGLDEDGWETVTGMSCEDPCYHASLMVMVHNYASHKSAEAALTSFVHGDWRKSLQVLETSVVPRLGSDSASCIFREDHMQSFACEVMEAESSVFFSGTVSLSRFDELRSLFLFVARSLRVGEAAKEGVGEEVTVPVAEM